MLLLTDGQHNLGASPLEAARLLGVRGVPVYTVGLGDLLPPRDLSIQDVVAPQTVFHKDRAKGQVTFLDTMPGGQAFKLRILCDGELLWQQELQTQGTGVRQVAFDFPVEKVVERFLNRKDEQLTYRSVTLPVKFEITALAGEHRADNNSETLAIQAATRRNRALVVEARPRWEWRYLNNLLTRDEQWETNSVMPETTAAGLNLKRGATPGAFPAAKADLFAYDLIVVGDVPASLFSADELGWLAEFVNERGGGMVLLDGRRANLAGYLGTAAEPLIPVSWEKTAALRLPGPLAVTAAGKAVSALDLGATGADNGADKLWAKLPPPHWLAAVQPLPGAEVILDAQVQDRRAPVLVFRRYGSGKVLYSAAEEFWRWRYVNADEYHDKFWNQVAGWIMDAPFPVQDKYVALDAGPAVHREGERVEIRARLRERGGAPLLNADAQALFYRGDQLVSAIPLVAEGNSGLYRATSGAFAAGDYTVRVKIGGMDPKQLPANARFMVRKAAARELAELSCNEKLLNQIAEASGGIAFREEQVGQIPGTLEALSSGRVEETDTALWQSWWFFAAIVVGLAIEWLWRRQAGLI